MKKPKQNTKRSSPFTCRMPDALKEHIKKTAKPNANAWTIKTLAKASGYKSGL